MLLLLLVVRLERAANVLIYTRHSHGEKLNDEKPQNREQQKTSSVVFVRIIFCNNNKIVTYAPYGVGNIHRIGVEILNTKKETKDSRTFGNRVAKFQNIQFPIIKREM